MLLYFYRGEHIILYNQNREVIDVSRRRVKDEERRNKSAKVRMNEIEYNEFDRASSELNLEKSFIIREAVKAYLADKGIHIWC